MKKASGTGAHIKGKGEIMLKKKEWLRRWRKFMLASGHRELWMIKILENGLSVDRNRHLSPGESANEHIEFWEDLQYANKNGG